MKIPLLCDQCRREFIGDEELMEIKREVICPNCEDIKLILD